MLIFHQLPHILKAFCCVFVRFTFETVLPYLLDMDYWFLVIIVSKAPFTYLNNKGEFSGGLISMLLFKVTKCSSFFVTKKEKTEKNSIYTL